jgi:cobalamin biosynthesis protein CobW
VVQGVGARFRHEYDRAWRPEEPRGGAIVVIGRRGLDRPAIEQAILG